MTTFSNPQLKYSNITFHNGKFIFQLFVKHRKVFIPILIQIRALDELLRSCFIIRHFLHLNFDQSNLHFSELYYRKLSELYLSPFYFTRFSFTFYFFFFLFIYRFINVPQFVSFFLKFSLSLVSLFCVLVLMVRCSFKLSL